jgi:hypothetical protein
MERFGAAQGQFWLKNLPAMLSMFLGVEMEHRDGSAVSGHPCSALMVGHGKARVRQGPATFQVRLLGNILVCVSSCCCDSMLALWDKAVVAFDVRFCLGGRELKTRGPARSSH